MALSPDNFFRIEGWMRTELDLKGNELMAYALIYSFQTAYNKPFDGSQAYIAEWLGISRISVNKTILKLKDKGILTIFQSRRGCVTFCSYDVLLDGSIAENIHSTSKESLQSRVKKVNTHELKKFTVTSKESLHKTDIETDILNRYSKERGKLEISSLSNLSENSTNSSTNNSTNENQKVKRFVKPTIEQIEKYCSENHLAIDAEYFFNYYESNGWMVGRVHMKDWHRTAQNWAKREQEYKQQQSRRNYYGNSRLTDANDEDIDFSEYDRPPDEIIYI